MAIRIKFNKYGSSEVLKIEKYLPNDPLYNEIQVENNVIGINFIDIYMRNGLYPVTNLPSGLGIEAAGVVIKKGKNIIDFKVGDRVVYAQGKLGAYSEIHNVKENVAVHLPDNISFKDAAACFLKGITVYYLFNKVYKIKYNEKFLFYAAAGGVGSIACQWAKLIGAKLIGVVGSENKRIIAKSFGAWDVINYKNENIVSRVNEITKGNKVRVVYDSFGKTTWFDSLDSLKKRGLMVSFGNASGFVKNINLDILNKKGSLYVTRPSIRDYISNKKELKKISKILFDMLLSGKLKAIVPSEQIFSLKDVKKIHDMIESKNTYASSLLVP
ncbi:NADPH:quinone reductase [Candidatus Providencia siddallii]|uniref:Quinone oxidoreductase 1 n=1 Tax=Candidatus Providencia siddallii TaxID=1715285 RepID=A0ABM9NPL2_9GAMM